MASKRFWNKKERKMEKPVKCIDCTKTLKKSKNAYTYLGKGPYCAYCFTERQYEDNSDNFWHDSVNSDEA